ncbi:tyrosine-protein phosphatase [Nocardia sp. NPDC051990]|uniref:tyrosine-protein phosphatase n=1 Tax=Nocardia sp. NPDC051990 TaxID=3155285 RepID=UPI003445E187
MPLDDKSDPEFWEYLERERLSGTPRFFRPFLERKPERCVAVVRAMARAQEGGVLFRCGLGRDRTGLIALLLLALVDAEPSAIAEDYTLSFRPGQDTSSHVQAVLEALDGLDVEACLLAAGASAADLASIRHRLAS